MRLVGPLQDLGPEVLGNVQASLRAGAWAGLILEGPSHTALDVPDECSHDSGTGKDGSGLQGMVLPLLELAGEGVWLGITGTWLIGEEKVKSGEEQRPTELSGVQPFG